LSYKPYNRNCNSCGKAITIGYDSNIQKWRPWDDYVGGINHQCANTQQQRQLSTGVMPTYNNQNYTHEVLDKLNTITNNQATIMWMLQKVAAKLGVESQSVQL